jgi:hypothetical protein
MMLEATAFPGETTDSTVSRTRPTDIVQTPPRTHIHEDARQTVAMLRRPDQTINVVLVALTDGVEVEVWADGVLRRRSRFLRDTEARKYSEKLAARLSGRGFEKGIDPR